MKRSSRNTVMRHESPVEIEEESFSTSESAIVGPEPEAKPKGPGRGHGKGGRRSVEDMLASHPNAILRSGYVLERINGLEDQIVKVLQLCDDETRDLVFRQRPSLRKYHAPDDGKG